MLDATPERAARIGWQPDTREGVYVLTDSAGDLFIGADNIVFQTRDHAQRWADEFAVTGPFTLQPKFVGFLRPEGWNFHV